MGLRERSRKKKSLGGSEVFFHSARVRRTRRSARRPPSDPVREPEGSHPSPLTPFFRAAYLFFLFFPWSNLWGGLLECSEAARPWGIEPYIFSLPRRSWKDKKGERVNGTRGRARRRDGGRLVRLIGGEGGMDRRGTETNFPRRPVLALFIFDFRATLEPRNRTRTTYYNYGGIGRGGLLAECVRYWLESVWM